MAGNILNSIVEPFSIDVLRLDFIFNNHFANKASFHNKFDPLTNDYIIGFWLAVFYATMINNENQIQDILFGSLGNNSGFKSLTIMPDKGDGGKKLLLIRNFFFNSDPRQIKHGGLSMDERQKLVPLIGEETEKKLVEYLVYDISSLGCTNRSEKMTRRPYMELQVNIKTGDSNAKGQVEKFFSLKDFMDLPRNLMREVSFLKNKPQNDDVKKIIRLIKSGLREGVMREMTYDLQIPFEYGFTHGLFFSTYPIHKLDVKVHVYNEEKLYVGLTLQKQTFIEVLGDFKPAVSYNLTGAKELIDPQEDFKQKVIEAVAKFGNKSEAGKLLSGYVRNLLNFATTLTLKFRGKNYTKSFLRGMLMTWPGPSTDYSRKAQRYDVYSINEYMQVVVRVHSLPECLLIFNFDDKIALNTDALKLSYFTSAIKGKCVWIVSISEIEIHCRENLIDKDIVYKSNVFLMNFGDSMEKAVSLDYKPLLETNFVRNLLLHLDLSDEESSTSIFKHYKHVMLALRDILELDKTAEFFDVLEGLFHDKSSYFENARYKNHQIDKFRSSNVFSLRIEKDGKIMQVNFMSTHHISEYIKRINATKSTNDHQVINFFYNHDKNIFSIHVKLGINFDNELFTASLCYDAHGNEVDCPDYKKSDRQKHGVREKLHGILKNVFETMRHNNMNYSRELREVVLARTSTKAIVDELEDPFYTLETLIDAKGFADDTAEFVKSIKKMKTMWKLTKMTLKAIIGGIGVPIIGLIVDVMELKELWKNYKDGERNAFAVFEMVATGTYIASGLVSLATGLLTLSGITVVPVIGWLVFTMGFMSFLSLQIWKIVENFEAFRKFFDSLWDNVSSFVSHPIDYLEREQVENINKVASMSIEIMENDAMIENVFSPPPCEESKNRKDRKYGCHNISINFDILSRYPKKHILSDAPNIPKKFTNKYRKLCALQTALSTITKIAKQLYDPHGAVLDFDCFDAVGVGRITNRTIPDPTSLYLLHGNSAVHAIKKTNSIFRLSGGRWCRIFGGWRDNTFIFSSVFEKCLLVGHKNTVNTVDFSEIKSLDGYEIEDRTKFVGVNLVSTWLKSNIEMENINIMVMEQHSFDSYIRIICSNVSIVIKQRAERLRKAYLKINIQNRNGCPYDLGITSHGAVKINNDAREGRIVYTFPEVTGNVSMYLNNNWGRVTHSIMWKSIGITDIRNASVLKLDNMTEEISFMFKQWKTTITLHNGTNSTLQMFADGSELKFVNNTFVIDLLFPKSKGQLWHTFSILFEFFKGSLLELNAYSERDDEFFVLTENEIRINHTTMPFSVFRSNFTKSTERRTIVCKSGYNIILVMTSCCESIPHILKKRAPWFDPFNVQIIENPDVLIVDLTFLIDTIKHFKKNYTIDIVLSIGELDATLNVFAMYWDDNSTDRYLIGTVTLESNLIDDRLYKKIRIMAKSNFVLTRDSTDLLKVVPLPIVICPLSPVVVLDRHTVQENQVILFNDRLLPNYDLVKLDNSTLLITDVVSNAAKGLIISDSSVPFLSIIVRNYKDHRMRTLMLMFERSMELKIDTLNESQILSFQEFDRRLVSITNSITEEGFILEHDTRFSAARAKAPTTPKASTSTKPPTTRKATSKRKITRPKNRNEKIRCMLLSDWPC